MGLDAALVPNMRQWFKKLVVSPKDVLFENAFLQIGVAHEYRGSQGRMSLFFGNRKGSLLSNFSVTIPEVPYLRMSAKPAPESLSASQQVGA